MKNLKYLASHVFERKGRKRNNALDESSFFRAVLLCSQFESALARNTYEGPHSAGIPARWWRGTAPAPNLSQSKITKSAKGFERVN